MKRRNALGFSKHKEVADWYDNKFIEMGGCWHTPVDELNEHLDKMGYPKNAKNTLLIDIGCGDGQLLAQALKRGGYCAGIDISDVGVTMSAQRCAEVTKSTIWRADGPDGIYCINGKRFTIYKAPMERLVDDDENGFGLWRGSTADFCISLGSMEHALDVKQAVTEMSRVLKTGGQWLLYVPTLDWIHEDQPLETIADPKDWVELCKSVNLITDSVTVINDNARIVGHREN